ncbi:DEKNAAC101055 [Brettanomyces naardenensis]|uniref:DEKNAAC101056 n=1 Tax=Brettanomyces naardenensis TaxID=13370 RepID=A0A448YGZ7_BRENA|nr:DEKNAAC101055 [Brettanomyces naardenensis]
MSAYLMNAPPSSIKSLSKEPSSISDDPTDDPSNVNVDTKKLTNANDIVRDKKSGVIDESKVKQAEENKKSSGDIPLVAGDHAAKAAAAAAAAGPAGIDGPPPKAASHTKQQSQQASFKELDGQNAQQSERPLSSSAETADDTSSQSVQPAKGSIQADTQLSSSPKKSTGNNENNRVEAVPASAVSSNKGDEEISNVDVEVGEIDEVTEEKDSEIESSFDAAKEFHEIMQLAPVVIFSKTYCPYSRKLKELLKISYEVTPSPAIVELDLNEHGDALQKYVAKMTGRSTVPNLMVKGISRGGCDDIMKLHEDGELVEEFKKWVGGSVRIEKVNVPSNN